MTRRLGTAFVLAALLGACGGGGSNDTAKSPAPAACTTPAATSAVDVVDSDFQPKTLCVKSGTVVTWTFKGSLPHTVTADDGSFDSKQKTKGATFTQTLNGTGTVAYYCTLHGTKNGGGMAGSITIIAG
jgi:plastocyanin